MKHAMFLVSVAIRRGLQGHDTPLLKAATIKHLQRACRKSWT